MEKKYTFIADIQKRLDAAIKKVHQMLTFADASFFQPMTALPVRPPPVRPPPVRPPHTPITVHTMEATSSETSITFAAYFQLRGPPPN
ncbi:hypothetical protein CRG98_007232 [Punica granatum]|uniref:Uncharacterized protein n=1 Tax=Punica granatum TaxID=22663 RepID=A0A2I0KV68_PUNGR|nr:hypothetical protein CRG98_007232 [Punica granatum]